MATANANAVANLDSTLALYSKGTRVWVPDDLDGWLGATVASMQRTGDSIAVTVVTERGKELTVSTTVAKVTATKDNYELPPLRNPPMLEGIEDLTNLSYLHEPAVLHNIRTRYSQHNIYTYSGIVLIAMNPFQRVQLYTPDVVRAYSGKRRGELEPHLFAVAEDAFRGMIRDKRNQSIIVSGESGAGKTVSAKYIMRYFATADASDSGASQQELTADELTSPSMGGADQGMSEVETQVLATNPIMESFGNAKTTRNDNSSRFGKYIELLFDTKYKIIGARVRTYLLERSRVVYQPETERNYHIFYQLVAGAPAAEKKELGLTQSHSYFHYLNQGGGSGTVPGVDDAQEFEITQRALSTIGVSVSVQWKIFRLLAAILHLGNMQIQNLRSDEAYIPDDEPSLVQAAKLLSVSPAEFKKWLVKKQINTRFEKIVSAVNATQANTIRDSVAKFLYAGLFEWLVDKTNESLCPTSVAESFSRFIGVLDIYGFEHFRKNSFEQFCINYANEKLQQEFTQHVFKLEQDEYVKEQIQWSFIDFNDNQPCIELIEGKLGILAILDEESRLPSGADKTLVEKLYTNFDKKHKFFSKPRFSNNSFIVHHFAHNVEYDAEGFLDKNKDTVPDELLAVFKASGFDFLTDVIDAHKVNKPAAGAPGAVVTSASTSPGVAANRNKAVKQTLGSVFKQSLVQLMETINSTNVSYIRCIKSNSEKKPFHFEPQMVLSQLRACGVLETIRISTAGYPGRWSFDEFVERYYLLLHSSQWGGFKDIRGLCSKLLTAKIPDQDKYQIGLTKIFFRAGQLAYLEKLRSERLNACVVMVQKNMRCWLARKKYLRLRKATILVQSRVRGYLARKKTLAIRQTLAVTKIQAHWRRWVAVRRYNKTREAIIKIQCAWRGYVARKALLALRKERAALKIQSAYRGYVERKAYRQARRRVVLAQSCIRRYLAKKELKQLKLEARSVNHFKEISYRLENKVVELTQTLDTKEKMVKSLNDTVKALEAQVRTWKEKYEGVLGVQQKLQDQLNETGGATREIEALTGANKGLTSQLNAANDVIKSKDTEIGGLTEQIAKLKEDLAKKQKELSTAASAVAAAPAATASPLSVQTSGLSGLAAVAAAAAAAAGVALPASAMPQQQPQTAPVHVPQPTPYSPRPAKQLTQQEMLIMESTQINALRQEIAALKSELASEKQRRESLMQQDEHNRRPSVDTMTTDMVWRQVTPIGPEAAGSSSSGYSGAAAPSAINFSAAAHAGNGPSPAVKAMRKLRRFSSHEIWNDEMRQMLHVDENSLMHGSMSVLGGAGAGRGGPGSTAESVNGAHASGRTSPPRTVEEALMEQEHTFSLLQDPKLESEIVDGLVRNLVIPKHATQDSSRRQIVFPAHVIGLFAIKLWQHGMNSNMQSFFKAVAQAIDDRCTYSNYDDEVVCFWLSNLAELESILKSASASASAAGAAAAAQRRTSIYMEGERILSKTRAEMEKLFLNLYVQWHRIVKKRLTKFIIPCVIENQSLPGFVSKDSASLFKKFVSTQQSYTIENLLDAVSGIWRVMKYYYLDDGMIRVTMSELFKMIGVTAFNHLIMRKNFATWKRGMQIQYNVSRLTEWCSQHSLPEAALHLERLMQAAKLLQLNKATPANIELYIEDLFDVCFLLSPTQISKLMSIYTVADFENPISPDILRAVASRSVSSDKQDLLLLEATSDTDTTWFVRPEPRKLLGVEKYLPQELELEMPRTILLFKFA
ncbi:P-loop containing nucleoside triphosphate hydrolase protein [Catenaria anguillulae PL171]|uniref:p-loop containing nucleoside triphosphate hydrolase protein n=1 Tax=Catenaria anguillulae PL171 TaxID=765915 RepID=A0A1Y2H9N9_9FUNG|nr:P-loop containing nucleoside triphosphate hydrolase protein [Catenaria anguillulae PL171]